MNPQTPSSQPDSNRTAVGTVRTFLGTAARLGLGAAFQIYLPRALGPDDFAAYAVTFSIVAWLEIGLMWPSCEALGILIADAAERWRPLARTAVVGLSALSLVAAAILALLAPAIAAALGDPGLTNYLRLFALDIPFFMLWSICQQVLTGLKRYERTIIVVNAYWVARIIVVVALVSAGLTVMGAVLGTIAASGLGALLGFRFLRPGRPKPEVSLRPLVSLGWPLALATLAIRTVRSFDIVAVKSMMPDAAAAGHYGVAAALHIGVLALVSTTAVTAAPTMVRALAEGNRRALASLTSQGYRFALLVSLAAVAIFNSSAHEITALVFGANYAPSAYPAGILMLAVLFGGLHAFAGAQLVAAGRSLHVLLANVIAVGVAIPLDLALVPSHGLAGAATATCVATTLGAVAAMSLAWREYGLFWRWSSTLRLALVAGLVYGLGMLWTVSGPLVMVKCLALGLVYIAGLLIVRELTRTDLRPVAAALKLK